MENHVKILGVLYIIGGALGLLVALIFVVVFGLGALGLASVAVHEDPEAALAIPIIGAIGTFLVVVIVILSITSIAAGFGLMKYRPWARILTIVLSALNLPSVPFGTALGIYGLWVLLNKETEPLFAAPGATAPQPPRASPPRPPGPR